VRNQAKSIKASKKGKTAERNIDRNEYIDCKHCFVLLSVCHRYDALKSAGLAGPVTPSVFPEGLFLLQVASSLHIIPYT